VDFKMEFCTILNNQKCLCAFQNCWFELIVHEDHVVTQTDWKKSISRCFLTPYITCDFIVYEVCCPVVWNLCTDWYKQKSTLFCCRLNADALLAQSLCCPSLSCSAAPQTASLCLPQPWGVRKYRSRALRMNVTDR